MPIASNSFNNGCQDGSVVSIAELRALVALLGGGEVMLAGGIMD